MIPLTAGAARPVYHAVGVIAMNRGEALRALRADHEAVNRVLAQLDSALARSENPETLAVLREAARFLAEDLARHLAREEGFLFPVLERHIGREGGPVGVMLYEHEELRRLWPAFQGAVEAADLAAAASVGRALADLLAEHVHKEDWVLFPLAERVLTEEELEELRWALEAEASG